MAHLIDKDALVAEVERQMSAIDNCPKLTDTQIAVLEGNKVVLTKLLSFIDTLEVKEVDLKAEIDRVWDNTSDNFSEDGWKEFEDIAKHFFELGLKAQKGE